MTTRRYLSLLLAVALLALTGQFNNPEAAAQSVTHRGTVSLLDQTDWNTGDNPFNITVHVDTDLDPANAELVITVYNQVATRFQFQQAHQDKITGASIILERHTLADVMGPDGNVSLSLPIQDPANIRYYLKDPGIYPVRVDLRTAGTGSVINRFVTDIINERPPVAPATELGVTMVLPVNSPQATDPKDVITTPDNGASIEPISKTLAAHPDTPVSVVADPSSIQLLDNAGAAPAKVVQDFQTALKTRPAMATTWTPVPAPMYSAELSNELNDQLEHGKAVLTSKFPTVDSTTWAATDPLDTTAVQSLQSRAFSRFIVRESDLSAVQRSNTLARPFALSLGKNKGTATAGMADQGLADHFSDPGGPILGGHHMLADLAVLWNDFPSQQRSVIVMPPRTWQPDPGFLETVFRGLDTSPVLAAQTVDQFFQTPTEGSGKNILTRQLQTLPKSLYANFPTSRIVEENKRIAGFSNLVDTTNKTLISFQHRLFRAESADMETKTRLAALDSIKEGIDQEISLIHMPAERSIRLTARQGEIPISVQNDTGYPVHVTIQLTSDKLTFPNGNTREITVDRQHVTERFTVEAKTSGSFPLQVRLESPDGKTTIERSRITVRSTATSAIGVGLSIGAGIFLLLWWIKSAVTTHRKKNLLKQTP